MKIKPEYKLREVAGMNIVVSTAGMEMNGIITANETGAFIWHRLEKGEGVQEITEALARECSVPAAQIEADVMDFINKLREASVLE